MLPTLVRRAITIIACPVVLAMTTGCAMTFDAQTLGVKATLASPATEPPAGTPFKVTRTGVFLFWGAFPVARPSLENALAGQLVGGAEVANVRIKVRSRFADVLLTVLTAGLVAPRSVTFEGVVVSR